MRQLVLLALAVLGLVPLWAGVALWLAQVPVSGAMLALVGVVWVGLSLAAFVESRRGVWQQPRALSPAEVAHVNRTVRAFLEKP